MNVNRTVHHYEAHLVVKGFGEKPGVDFLEMFSSVVRWDTIRTVLKIAAS